MYFSFLINVSVIDWGDFKEGIHNVGSNWFCSATSFVLYLIGLFLITLICSFILYLSSSSSSSSVSESYLSARSGNDSSSSMIISFMFVFAVVDSFDRLLLLFLWKDSVELLFIFCFVYKAFFVGYLFMIRSIVGVCIVVI